MPLCPKCAHCLMLCKKHNSALATSNMPQWDVGYLFKSRRLPWLGLLLALLAPVEELRKLCID